MRCPCLKPARGRLHLESPNLPSPPSRTNARPIQSMTLKTTQLVPGVPHPTLPRKRGRVGWGRNPAVAEGLPPLPAPLSPVAVEGGEGASRSANHINLASTPPSP